jgi:hypothetical protein
MQTLINALVLGHKEYKDDGVVITHPPSALDLRAARAISTLIQSLEGCDRGNRTLCLEIEQLKQENNILKAKLNEPIGPIPGDEPNVPNLRDGEWQTSEMGSTGSGDPGPSDSASEGSGTN